MLAQQFIIYRLRPKANGKLDKIPTSIDGRFDINAHDPRNWHPKEVAESAARQLGQGYGVGLVLTENCRVFFLDADGCSDGSQWSPLFLTLWNRLAGRCYAERSVSGTGAHFAGLYSGDRPSHKCKNTALGLELYTADRFIALGDPMAGDLMNLQDCSAEFAWLIEQYFQKSPDADRPHYGAGDAPQLSDAEILRMLVAQRPGAAAAFGGKATFADIMEGRNLSNDDSANDLAAANYIAFYTKDPEQIERIMRATPLVRDKWDSHKDYLQGFTIPEALRTCSGQWQPKIVRNPVEWTDTPAAEWCGAKDNRALRARMRASGREVNGLTYAQIMSNDQALFAEKFPDNVGGGDYLVRPLDKCLAMHLAFFTGRHCDRMFELMGDAPYVRPYPDVAEEVRRIVLEACAETPRVYTNETLRHNVAVRAAVAADGDSAEPERIEAMTLEEMQDRFVLVGGTDVFDLYRPKAYPVALAAFRTLTANSKMEVIDKEGNAKTIQVSSAWLTDADGVKKCDGVTFKPGAKAFAQNPLGQFCANSWSPIVHTAAPADPSAFVFQVELLWGTHAARFFDWLAHMAQNPGELPQTAWVHVSDNTGTGRSWVGKVLADVFKGYVAMPFNLTGALASGFNGELSGKLLAITEELHAGKSKWQHTETLKQMITEPARLINPKYGKQSVEWNVCRQIIFSNFITAVPADDTERRLEVVEYTGAPMDDEYYAKLHRLLKSKEFIAGVWAFLVNRDLSKYNPGRHAERSEAKLRLIRETESEPERLLRHLVEDCPTDIITNDALRSATDKDPAFFRHAFLKQKGVGRRTFKNSAGKTIRLVILRNVERWSKEPATVIETELSKLSIGWRPSA